MFCMLFSMCYSIPNILVFYPFQPLLQEDLGVFHEGLSVIEGSLRWMRGILVEAVLRGDARSFPVYYLRITAHQHDSIHRIQSVHQDHINDKVLLLLRCKCLVLWHHSTRNSGA